MQNFWCGVVLDYENSADSLTYMFSCGLHATLHHRLSAITHRRYVSFIRKHSPPNYCVVGWGFFNPLSTHKTGKKD